MGGRSCALGAVQWGWVSMFSSAVFRGHDNRQAAKALRDGSAGTIGSNLSGRRTKRRLYTSAMDVLSPSEPGKRAAFNDIPGGDSQVPDRSMVTRSLVCCGERIGYARSKAVRVALWLSPAAG